MSFPGANFSPPPTEEEKKADTAANRAVDSLRKAEIENDRLKRELADYELAANVEAALRREAHKQIDGLQKSAKSQRDEVERLRRLLGDHIWTCKYRNSGMGGNDPQECAWPQCGCDPAANRVLENLDECGFEIVERRKLADTSASCPRCGFNVLGLKDGGAAGRCFSMAEAGLKDDGAAVDASVGETVAVAVAEAGLMTSAERAKIDHDYLQLLKRNIAIQRSEGMTPAERAAALSDHFYVEPLAKGGLHPPLEPHDEQDIAKDEQDIAKAAERILPYSIKAAAATADRFADAGKSMHDPQAQFDCDVVYADADSVKALGGGSVVIHTSEITRLINEAAANWKEKFEKADEDVHRLMKQVSELRNELGGRDRAVASNVELTAVVKMMREFVDDVLTAGDGVSNKIFKEACADLLRQVDEIIITIKPEFIDPVVAPGGLPDNFTPLVKDWFTISGRDTQDIYGTIPSAPMPLTHDCRQCHGTGRFRGSPNVLDWSSCLVCSGTGKVTV